MQRFLLAFFMMSLVSISVGCGDSKDAGTAFDQDELAKYAEENPAPYIGGDGADFEEVE